MPKIKIVLARGIESSYDDYESRTIIVDGTQWDDVTDEELKILKDNIYSLKMPLGYNRGEYSLHIIEQDKFTIRERLDEVRTIMAHLEKQRQKQEAEREKQRQERERKKAIKKAEADKLDKANKRKLYEQLKRELGDV